MTRNGALKHKDLILEWAEHSETKVFGRRINSTIWIKLTGEDLDWNDDWEYKLVYPKREVFCNFPREKRFKVMCYLSEREAKEALLDSEIYYKAIVVRMVEPNEENQ